MDRAAGAETVRAAAQDHRVAGLQAQRAGIGGDVGAALEDHADDAERRAHALDGQAVRPLPALGDARRPDRRSPRTVATPSAIASMRAGVSVSRSMKAAVAPPCADFRDVLGIGGEDGGRIGADGALDRLQRAVLLLRRGKRQHPRGGARAARPISAISAGRSALPSIAFSGALMAVPGQLSHVLARKSALCDVREHGCDGRHRVGGWPLGHWPSRSAVADHQIVAMDHLRAAAMPSIASMSRRRAALDQLGIVGVVGDEPAPDLAAVGAAHHHGVAARELARRPG